MSKNVVVKGAYGEANFGDDALMCTIENFFLEKVLSVKVSFCGNSSNYCRRLLRGADYVDVNSDSKEEADVLIYGGGTQFFLFSSNKGSFYLKLFLKLLVSNPAMLVRKVRNRLTEKRPVTAKSSVGLGLGLGPFNPDNDRVEHVKSLVRRMDMLFVRDEKSLSYCKEWGLENVGEGADICYSRFLNYNTGRINGNTNNREKRRKKIGIIVRDWKYKNGGGDYREVLMAMVDEQKEGPYEYTFIIFSGLLDVEWKRVVQEHGYASLEWDPMNQNINDFMDTLNDFDGFITARYHGGVMASILNKPVVCIEIEPKLRILAEQIKGFRLWRHPFRVDELKQAMTVFDDNSFDCSESVSVLREKADAMFDSLEKYLMSL